MNLGAFSVSLAVKDLAASMAFYEKLGFTSFHAEDQQNWAILKNGDHVIGLFQGMFERNLLTFNPGWDQGAQAVADYTDVREIQRALQEAGIELDQTTEAGSSGPGFVMLTDPDGNPILIDQHV